MVLLGVIICQVLGQAQASPVPDSTMAMLDRITNLDVSKTDGATTIVIQGNGLMPAVATRTIAFPPRIVIDLLATTPRFKSIVKEVSDAKLKSIRIGHHPSAIRLVLDVSGSEVPRFSTSLQDQELIVCLTPPPLKDNSDLPADKDRPQVDGNEVAISILNPIQEVAEFIPVNQKTIEFGLETSGSDPSDKKSSNQIQISNNVENRRASVSMPNESVQTIFDADATLAEIETVNPQVDIAGYLNAVMAYQANNWPGALDHLNEFIESSPPNLHVEKAFFLLAKTYDRQYTDSLDNHFNKIWDAYKDAIYRYPESAYTPDAYLSIGNLFFRTQIYSEALGYYNLVIEMDHFAKATISAFLKKAQILSHKNKKREALKIYRLVVERFPQTPGSIQAKVEMAGVMFDLNQFGQARNVLEKLEQNPKFAYAYPALLQYLGDIYFQLGMYSKARKQLLRFYNCRPDTDESPLVLARIADTYREDGLIADATKFYRLTIKRHAQTEGALISMYRLAAMQESGGLTPEEGLVSELNIMGAKLNFPRKIYEDVIQNAIDNNKQTPLLQYALLKLSLLDQREGKYEDSLKRLKDLLKQYPHTNLKPEIEQTFEKTLLSILEKKLGAKKFIQVLNVYQAEKNNIEALNSPEIYIVIARAALALELTDLGDEMFSMAAKQLPDEQKPSDLIYHVGQELYRRGEFRRALAQMDLLLDKDPIDSYSGQAWLLKGQIYVAINEYEKSVQMFARALDHNAKSCQRKDILMLQAKALIHMKSTQNAEQALAQAQGEMASCFDSTFQMYAEIGLLYLQLGEPQRALDVITTAHEMAKDVSSKTRLKILMARCYEHMNQKDSYLAIYAEVANQEDPFWRHVAREKMESVNFETIRSEIN